jgi:hypothetical protein
MTATHLDILGDTVHQYAAEHGLEVATNPLVVANEPLIAQAMPPDSVPIEEIAEFGASANGQPVDRLGAMVLQLEAAKPSHGGGFLPEAFLEQDGLLYYPIIKVNVLANNPNWWIRHELRHPFQEAKGKLPYQRPAVNWGVRAAGAASLVADALTTEYAPTLAVLPHLLWAAASIAPLIEPQIITHTFTPAEIDAQRFSYCHRKFAPLPRLRML